MTENDIEYIHALIKAGVFNGPVLELGAGYGGLTSRELIAKAGFDYYATDMTASEGVTYAADFSSAESVTEVFGGHRFGCVLALNVLEHTFEPILILDNAFRLVKPGGCLVVITPAVWTLHNYPMDCYRLLPNWYEQYATTRSCDLLQEHFYFVGYGKIANFTDQDGNYQLPAPADNRKFKYWWSRLIQKTFNTYGRGMAFPSHIAIGAVLRK